jgi:DNA-binding beta-propeller fold protein YncE
LHDIPRHPFEYSHRLVIFTLLYFFPDTVAIFSPGYGTTVAGSCNGSTSTNQTLLLAPGGILLMPNGTLYVGNGDGKLFAFDSNDRTARTVDQYGTTAPFLSYDKRTFELHISVQNSQRVYILPGNRTIPPNGIQANSCNLSTVYFPLGVVVDSVGSVYIASLFCNWITKWSVNATEGALIAGSPTGAAGNTSTLLYSPFALALDETKSVIYVVDNGNNRIQRFPLDGSGIGVTVAGGNGAGSAASKLSYPRGVYLSKSGDLMYICDSGNHRVQKWRINGTSGVTVAGSSFGLFGKQSNRMKRPSAITLDAEERYLYVSDADNDRVQRFILP